MPTLVSDLFANADIELYGPVPWSHPVENRTPGGYVVSTSADPEQYLGLTGTAPICSDKVAKWIDRVTSIRLDGVSNLKAADIVHRLAEFWLPDENILYIGMTSATVRKRVQQYYNTPLGDRRPHVGGHWLKTLSNLSELFISHAVCEAPKSIENQLLGYFVSNVSSETKSQLRDPDHPFPFANLEYPKGTRKMHGIRKSTL